MTQWQSTGLDPGHGVEQGKNKIAVASMCMVMTLTCTVITILLEMLGVLRKPDRLSLRH